jgi:hypothetical protein
MHSLVISKIWVGLLKSTMKLRNFPELISFSPASLRGNSFRIAGPHPPEDCRLRLERFRYGGAPSRLTMH